MGAFYATYINHHFKKSLHLIVEQGHEIEKDGRVMVRILKNNESLDVEITGNAVYVKDFDILLEEAKPI